MLALKSHRFLAAGLVACIGHLGCSEPQAPTTTASTGAVQPAPAGATKSKGGRRSRPPKVPLGAPGSEKAETKPSTGIRNDL
jgi:hypothetical protein